MVEETDEIAKIVFVEEMYKNFKKRIEKLEESL